MNNVNKENKNNESAPKGQFIQVPFTILADKELKTSEKLLYGLIKSYAKQKGYCFATNKHLAEMLGLADNTISGLVTGLKTKGYITTKEVFSNNWSYQSQRWIYLTNKASELELPNTSHAGEPVLKSDMGVLESDTPYDKYEPPIENEVGGHREHDTPHRIDGMGGREDEMGTLEDRTPHLGNVNIIDNNNKELEVDNENREIEIDNTNSDFGIDSTSEETTSNVEDDFSEEELVIYYTDEDIDKYFNNELFNTYWNNAYRNPDFKTKDELLSIEISKRKHSKSFEFFNKICKIVDEKEAIKRSNLRENTINSFVENHPIANWSNSELKELFSKLVDQYYNQFQEYPKSGNDERFIEITSKHFNSNSNNE